MTTASNEPTLSDIVGQAIAVLVAGTDTSANAATAVVLRGAGYEVTVATTFKQARSLLSSQKPDLLVTDIQLEAYNGLHLVWQRRIEQPGRPSMVLNAYPDPVLEAEARRLGCPFLITPVAPAELLEVARSLPLARPAIDEKRRWPRTLVGPRLGLVMSQGPATMLDVSYGGCRLRFTQGAEIPLSRLLHVPIPTSEEKIEGIPVWRNSGDGGDVYGIAVSETGKVGPAWRKFVDGLAEYP